MKQRFLDTLKMIGVCVAVIAFFSFLAASCEDRETQAERETAMEELRDQVWEEAYQRGYEDGYDVGYDNGYYSALEENVRAMPEVITPSDDFTVYVSRSGTMHLKENCSGMTHSTAMPYSVASQYYDKKCGNCFKSMPKN